MTSEVEELIYRLWPKQLQALNSPANEMLYGGAAGPGKSHLLRVAFIGWALEIPGLQLFLFRRRYRDLIQGHMEGPTGFRALLDPLVKSGMAEIVALEIRFRNGGKDKNEWVGGSRISLNHCQHEQDALNYKTIEFHVLGLEETTEFTPFQIKFLRGRVRMPTSVVIPEKYLMPQEFWRRPDKPRYSFPRCLYPTNPGGASHNYLKTAFVDAHEPYTLFNAPKEDGGMLRVFIPGLLTDNPSIDPEEYENTLSGLPPAYREALLKGSWNAPIGAFYPEFDREKHVIPDQNLPEHLFRFMTYDWGSGGNSDPFCCYWWAVSTGFVLGEKYIPRGAYICYREWFGIDDSEPTSPIALKLTNEEQRDGIIRRTEKRFLKQPILADKWCFAERGGPSVREIFDCHGDGINLIPADDSRVTGWAQGRGRLRGKRLSPADLENTPMVYFMESCRWMITYLPMLPYHSSSETKPADAAEHGESTHSSDCFRYASTAHTVITDAQRTDPAQMREKIAVAIKQKQTLTDVIGNPFE